MKRILLSLMTILFIVPAMAQESVSLRMNLEKNKLYRLKSVSEQTVTQTVSGNQQTVETEVVYMMSVKMLDMTPDFMVTEVHFDTIITNTNTMGRLSTISSAVEGDMASSETSDIMSCVMNRLSKNALFVKIDYSGKPLEIVNGKMLSDMILKDTASITLAEPVASALKEQIAGTVSNNTMLTMVSGFTRNLPGKEVAVGDNWETTDQVNSGGMLLSITTSYHLDGIDGNNARITAESNIRAAENAPPIQSAGATVAYDNLTGLSKSEMVIDSSTGLLVENNAKSHITGNLGISGPGFSMQMPMDINGETRITLIE